MTSNIAAFALVALAAAGAFAGEGKRRNAVVEVVEKVSPAVVYIGTEQIVESRFRGGGLFDEFFFGPRERKESVQGLGSGVIIDPAGLVLTNDHVIRGASAIHVVLADGRQIDADVIGSDADNDLALLKIQSKSALPHAKLGTSRDLMIGETVIAIGSPFGLSKTVTVGALSATGRSFKADGKTYNDFLQTDAAINPGNSGGPLLNADGDIIGINTAIFASAQGIGFAIPADKVRRIVTELTQFGKLRPAWIGVSVENLPVEAAAAKGWDKNYGVRVTAVDTGSPAQKAGVRVGDIVTEIGGARVSSEEDFDTRLRGYPAGAEVSFSLFREGATRVLTFTAVEFPMKRAEGLAWERLGLRVSKSRQGVALSAVRQGSAADRIGLSAGDVLLRFNNQTLDSVDAFLQAVVSARQSKSVLLLVQRGRRGYYITLPF
jgi:serine protease Do